MLTAGRLLLIGSTLVALTSGCGGSDTGAQSGEGSSRTSDTAQAANPPTATVDDNSGALDEELPEGCLSDDKSVSCNVTQRTFTVSCGDGKYFVTQGSGGDVTVTGSCQGFHMSGFDNKFSLESITGTITVNGTGNTITYVSGDPQVEYTMEDGSNTVSRR